jgi:hypothetical protein
MPWNRSLPRVQDLPHTRRFGVASPRVNLPLSSALAITEMLPIRCSTSSARRMRYFGVRGSAKGSNAVNLPVVKPADLQSLFREIRGTER